MCKAWNCPVADGTNERSLIELFMMCYNPSQDSMDVSTAIFEWKRQNYHRASERDMQMMGKLGLANAFKVFLDTLTEVFGAEHITEPLKCKTGYKGQSRMTLARKHPRAPKKRNFAFNRKDNQLAYLGVRL